MTTVIDAHSHLYSQSYMNLLTSRSEIPRIDERGGSNYFVIFPEEERTGGRLIQPTMWSVEGKLAHMADGGFDHSVVSLGNPWLDPIQGPESVDLAHQVNEDFARFEANRANSKPRQYCSNVVTRCNRESCVWLLNWHRSCDVLATKQRNPKTRSTSWVCLRGHATS